MSKYPLVSLFFILLILSVSCKKTKQADSGSAEKEWVDSMQYAYKYGVRIDSLDCIEYTIKRGDNPASIFASLGFSARKADSISRASHGLLDPTKLREGRPYYILSTQDSVPEIKYIIFAKDFIDHVVIGFERDSISVTDFKKEITYKRKYVEGVIKSSLWNEIKNAGGDPILALKISDLYAWQIDFFDVKSGDSYKVIYDVAYIDDTTKLSVSTVHGAIFNHRGKDFTAIPFTQDSIFEYFDEEGNSLRKAFLKAPLDFFRITSKFSNARFHPILKRYRAHHGVDYAAPVGTPVKSIGDGVVIAKGYEGGGGNYLKVKHNAVYTTTYMHLHNFAKGIQMGSKVQQGEVIAYVGSTGLSTGPHLDFRVHKNGQPINPLDMEAPPSLPVKPELMDSFIMVKKHILMEMDSCHNMFESKNQEML